MKRVAELSIKKLNAETRPYKIIGCYPGSEHDSATIIVKYLDVYEYCVEWAQVSIGLKQSNGWGIYSTGLDHEGSLHCILRRAKPESEAGNG
jgi:hypothetical protein